MDMHFFPFCLYNISSYQHIYFFKTQNLSWSFTHLLPNYIYEETTLTTFLIACLWKNKHATLKEERHTLCPEILPTPTLFFTSLWNLLSRTWAYKLISNPVELSTVHAWQALNCLASIWNVLISINLKLNLIL